jgi:hypothetical protein
MSGQEPQGPYRYPVYGYPQRRRTNGLAVAALVCGICGFLYLVPAVLGIVFGAVSLRQISRDGTQGKGMAVTGIVVGAFWLLSIVALAVWIFHVGDNGG